MPEHNEREETKPTLAEALEGFDDSPTLEEYQAEFAGQPSPTALPTASPPPAVAPLADAEDQIVRELREYSGYIGGWEDEEGRNWGSALIAVLADKIESHFASLRAALAAAEKERDAARREARELRERAESRERFLRLVVADVECYCTDEYPRPCASCEARGLLGGEGA